MTATPTHSSHPTLTPATEAAEAALAAHIARGPARALLATTKPGITRLVTMTASVGFILAAVTRPWQITELLSIAASCVVGTALSAAGANALNQWMERRRDALMPRTLTRPIPAGEVAAQTVLLFGAILSVLGLGTLWLGCGLVPMVVSLACIVSYLIFYTPMKVTTPLATFVGAIPGALPPIIGASAASAYSGWQTFFEPAGLALFTLMFVWQIPHFLAIAWMYKEDYRKGGYAVLPVLDATGTATSWTVLLWAGALLPASLLPAMITRGTLGGPYLAIAGVLGLLYFALCVRLVLDRTRERARQVFLASIMHLPILLLAIVIEAVARAIA
jgi:heme o synthase